MSKSTPTISTPASPERVLVVDHYDSYTWSLVHLIASVTGTLPTVAEHDSISTEELAAATHVVLSPGPGSPNHPRDFALSGWLRETRTPVLGVCLGLQGMVTSFGGVVKQAPPAHGWVSHISHSGTGLFTGIPQDFAAVRYHSLRATRVPDSFDVTAWSEDHAVMGIAHRTKPLVAVQFHPESILSEHGTDLVRNFLTLEAAA